MSAASLTWGSRHALETQLIEKAWKDPVFRQEIRRDPKGLLERHLGQKLPESLQIFVHEEDANTLHFAIPPAPARLTELSDEELEKVAGGTEITLVYLGIAATIGVVATSGAVLGVGVSKDGW